MYIISLYTDNDILYRYYYPHLMDDKNKVQKVETIFLMDIVLDSDLLQSSGSKIWIYSKSRLIHFLDLID